MNLDKDARFICVWLLHLFDDLRIVTDTKISIKSSFMEIVFLFMFNRSYVPSKNHVLLFRVNCRL